MTRSPRRSLALSVSLLLGFLAAGCATLSPPQQRSADEVRAMVAETTRAYGVPRIYVLIGQDVGNVGGTYRRGLITLSTPMLLSRHRDSVVAHELAHYLLGHDAPLTGNSALDRHREQEARELDANAKAVEILTRAGRHEAEALRTVYNHLHTFHRAVVAGRQAPPWGHRSACEEIGDLLARFPAQRAWTASLECAGPTATAGAPAGDDARAGAVGDGTR